MQDNFVCFTNYYGFKDRGSDAHSVFDDGQADDRRAKRRPDVVLQAMFTQKSPSRNLSDI